MIGSYYAAEWFRKRRSRPRPQSLQRPRRRRPRETETATGVSRTGPSPPPLASRSTATAGRLDPRAVSPARTPLNQAISLSLIRPRAGLVSPSRTACPRRCAPGETRVKRHGRCNEHHREAAQRDQAHRGGPGLAPALSRRRRGDHRSRALLAACGDDEESTAPAPRSTAMSDDDGLAVRRGRSRHRQLRADPRVPRGGVLRRGRQERPVQGRRPGPDQGDRPERAGARRRADGDGEGRWAASRRRSRRRSSRSTTRSPCWSSRRRSRTSAPRPIWARRRAIESPDILAAALSIHSVEGRHAAALNTLTGQPITPDGAFAKPADAEKVLAAGPAVHRQLTATNEKGETHMAEQTMQNPELAAVEVEELSRGSFIAKGALAAGARLRHARGGPAGAASAFAQGSSGDVDILNFALTLEYLEAAFYDAGAGGGAEPGQRGLGPRQPDRERRERARQGADRDDRGPGRQARQGPRRRLRRGVRERGRVPQAGADVRGHRRQRLQRRGSDDRVEGRARRRPGRSSRSRLATRRPSASSTASRRHRRRSTWPWTRSRS